MLYGNSLNVLTVLRTVPTFAIAHTFCASGDTRVSFVWCLLIPRDYEVPHSLLLIQGSK